MQAHGKAAIDYLKNLARRHIPLRVRSIPRRMAGAVQDYLIGIRCEGWHYPTESERQAMLCSDGNMYQLVTYEILKTVSKVIPIDEQDIFYDLGCGKGRVVAYFARNFRMKKVVGVELVPELAQIAQSNIDVVNLKSPAEIRCQDV